MSESTRSPGVVDARTETVTFLFTDIEGSTGLLQEIGEERYGELLARHDQLLHEVVEGHGGRVFGSAGDGLFSAFPTATAAVGAAVAAQQTLGRELCDPPVRVRIAVHVGEATTTHSGDYSGLALHRVARLLGVAGGRQVLVSQAVAELVADRLDGVELRDLGDHRLRDLARPERIFQVLADGVSTGPPTGARTAGNLPQAVTSFVGRERELAELAVLLERSRLVTLTGPGGTGKTRLATRLGAEVGERFPDGVWVVQLAPVREPELVPSAVLEALGLPEAGTAPPATWLAGQLADRDLLLILDNFEQILGAAPVVAEVLAGAPHVQVVVTSRAPLRVSGEQEYPVPPLPVPTADGDALGDNEAVALFVERARAVVPSFRLAAGDGPAVVRIVAAVDGLPLAIELAAARVKLLSPAGIAARLDDRLGLLSAGARDLPARQQTLRDAIAWSYDLLDEAARRLLARLSVFAGGAGLAHAEAVCGPADDLGADVLDGLGFLVDQSLLRRVPSDDGEPRFELLETIREFAAEQLEAGGEAEPVRDRHLDTYLAVAEAGAPHLTGPAQGEWLDRLEVEHGNLRAALAWAVRRRRTGQALRLVTSMWRFWQIRGHLNEARRRVEEVLALPDLESHPGLLAPALEAAGGIAYWQGEARASRAFYERSLELYRAAGDRLCVAYGLYNLSFAYSFDRTPDAVTAGRLLDEALELFRAVGDRHGEARTLWAQGSMAYVEGDYTLARRQLAESLMAFGELGVPFDVGWAHRMLALAELRDGDHEAARGDLRAATAVFRDVRDLSAIVMLLNDFGFLAQVEGRGDRALRLAGAVERWERHSGAELAESERFYEDRPDPAAGLDPQRVAALLAEGRAWDLDTAVAYALGT